MLGESVKARYLELLGEPGTFPEGGYQGEYITRIAGTLHGEHGAGLRDEPADGGSRMPRRSPSSPTSRRTLARIGIRFDVYFNEDSLYNGGQIAAILNELRARDLAFDHDGAVWLRGEPLGLDKDRVLVKSTRRAGVSLARHRLP